MLSVTEILLTTKAIPSPSQPLLTCGKGSEVSTLLSMAKTKAAVFPVPDWLWAMRFWGL